MSMERYLEDVGDIIGEIGMWRDSRGFWWRFQVFYIAQGRGGDSTLALGELMSTPMVALASSVEMTWRGSMDSFYLGQEGSEINNFRRDHGRAVPRWCYGDVPALVENFIPHISSPLLGMPTRLEGFSNKASRRRGDHYFYPPRRARSQRMEKHCLLHGVVAVYKYSISLSEFRNLFSLNCNPKTDQGWLYFKARETRKFCSEDTPATLRGGRASSFLSLATNGRFPRECLGRVLQEFRGRGGFQIRTAIILPGSMATKRKSLKRFSGRSRSRDASPYPCYWNPNHFAESLSLSVLGRRGRQAIICREENRRAPRAMWVSPKIPMNKHGEKSPSRDDSIECLGSFRTELRRLLPHIPDLTLLRWTGEKVLDPILDHYLNVPSSNPSSESCSDSSLPIELESDGIAPFFFLGDDYSSYLIRMLFCRYVEEGQLQKDWREAWEGGECELGGFRSGKGVIIGEKQPGESITSSPSKKGKVDDGSKGKGVVIGPEDKKKATPSGKAPTPPATASPRPGEGSSANLGTVLGPTASMLGSPSVAEKLLRGVIPPADKEKVEQLTLDQTATKLFHVIGQALVLGSSLAVRSREAGEQASLQEGRAASMETEIARLQKRSGVLVNELREALNKSKEFAVEEFKSSSEFMVAVEESASKYFGEGFNFCKVQLRRHHPDLAIDLEGTVVDHDLLAEQDEADEENDKEKTGENEGGK
ncbi:hypothetical protein Acr_10g0004890 [Actinidia rufa]|uniref:Uncharacterized protein n=1 Tax=Actinidia rufa TaxID=165716 RepID=A0A7J0F8R7_9ERIC|nr:hypothetical protein Acr_10g0004890 [Actinidia rufa]